MTGAALSFASPASNFNPTSSISSVSHVAPSAVAEGRHFAGVLMKKWLPLIPACMRSELLYFSREELTYHWGHH